MAPGLLVARDCLCVLCGRRAEGSTVLDRGRLSASLVAPDWLGSSVGPTMVAQRRFVREVPARSPFDRGR